MVPFTEARRVVSGADGLGWREVHARNELSARCARNRRALQTQLQWPSIHPESSGSHSSQRRPARRLVVCVFPESKCSLHSVMTQNNQKSRTSDDSMKELGDRHSCQPVVQTPWARGHLAGSEPKSRRLGALHLCSYRRGSKSAP